MANIQLKIRTLADNDTEINSIKNTGNNVTNGSVKLANSEDFFATIPTADFAGQELLTFAGGALRFTSNGILANGSGNVGRLVDESDGKEFIWGVVPEGGEYYVEVQLSVSNLDLTAITLYGDSVAQQYPTEVIVNGQTYQNDDVVLTIPVNTNSTQINVKMTKWKRENYNACLTKIAIFAGEIQLENRDIKSLESLSQSTGQPESIFYGCVPSSGSASINDRKGEFYDYIKNGVISNSNSAIDLFVNGKKVQTHIATDSDYDLGGRVFSLDLENKLSAYDNIMYEGYPYTGNSQSLYDIFVGFATSVGFTDQIEKMLSTEIEYTVNENNYVGKVAEYFKSIIIPYPYIERGTVRETLDKFCTLAQLNLIEDDNGDLIFVQARPIRTGSERVLVIPAKNQMSAIDRNIIVKNQVNTVFVTTKKTTDETKYNEIIGQVVVEKPNTYYIPKYLWQQTEGAVSISGSNPRTSRLAVYLGTSSVGYYTGKFSVPSKKGFTRIINPYSGLNANGEPYIKYKLIYIKRKGTASFSQKITSYTSDNYPSLPFIPPYPDGDGIVYNQIGADEYFIDNGELAFGSLDNEIYVGLSGGIGLMAPRIELDNQTNLVSGHFTLNQTTGEYEFNYKVLGARKFVRMTSDMPQYATQVEFAGNYTTDASGNFISHISGVAVTDFEGYEEYIPQELEISFYGDRRVISFEDVDNSSEEQGSGNIITISGNELLQENTLIGDAPLAIQISDNIVTDYKNGVSTCRVTVICGDYKDEAGVVRKNWAKGEILQVGDIVRLDKDNDGTPAVTYKDGSPMLWKITGRNLRHEGVSLLDLELQEIF